MAIGNLGLEALFMVTSDQGVVQQTVACFVEATDCVQVLGRAVQHILLLVLVSIINWSSSL